MKYYLLIFFVLASLPLVASTHLDTLYGEWKNNNLTVTNRIDSFTEYIGSGFINTNPDSAKVLIEQLQNFADLKRSQYGKAKVLQLNGIINTKLGEYTQSIKFYDQSIALFKSLKERKGIAESYSYIATTYYYLGEYKTALNYFRKVISIQIELDSNEDLAGTYVNIGSVYLVQSQYTEGLLYYQKALDIYKKLKNKSDIAFLLNNFGVTYKEKGDYLRALDYFRKSLAIKENLNNYSSLAATIHNIGKIYLELKEYDKGISYFERSLKLEQQASNKKGIASDYYSLGAIYQEKKDFQKSFHFYQNSLGLQKEIGDKEGIAVTLSSLGSIQRELKDYKLAQNYFAESNKIFKELSIMSNLSKNYSLIGMNYLDQKNVNLAIVECKKGLQIADSIGSLELKKLNCDCLYEAYKAQGSFKNALLYNERSIQIANNLNLEETAKRLQQMEFQKEKMADSLKLEKEKIATTLQFEKKINTENQNRNIAIAVGFLLLLLTGGLFSRIRYIRKSRDVISAERDRSEDLLLNILPAQIARELKEKGHSEARSFDDVTILFTDFKEFTQKSEILDAKNLINEINICFEYFDNICDKYGLEKIKTIGDSYMAASGLPESSANATKKAVLASIEMAQYIIDRKEDRINKGKIPFEMRVGVHTGPVVAGIVGKKKFQYDVWGDTVNTASRMESGGEVDKVNVSKSVYEKLKYYDEFEFEYRGKIAAKGKGEVEMYFVKLK